MNFNLKESETWMPGNIVVGHIGEDNTIHASENVRGHGELRELYPQITYNADKCWRYNKKYKILFFWELPKDIEKINIVKEYLKKNKYTVKHIESIDSYTMRNRDLALYLSHGGYQYHHPPSTKAKIKSFTYDPDIAAVAEYKNYYHDLKNEAEIPFSSANIVGSGLRAKYGDETLDAYTFGIELEFEADEDSEYEYDWNEIYSQMESNSQVRDEYHEHVENEREKRNRRWNGHIESWDDKHGPVDVDKYKEYNPEPRPDNYSNDDEYQDALAQWNENVTSVENDYEYWKKYNYWDEFSDFINSLDATDYIDIEYYATRNVDTEINSAVSYIKNMGQNAIKGSQANKNTWAVGEDAGGQIEIRSKHLTQNEFHLVEKICDFVAMETTSGGTSAHVHIGLPNDFDAFDLLAITTLVDEKAIQSTVGPSRELKAFAKLRANLHRSFFQIINTSTQTDQSIFIKTDRIFRHIEHMDRMFGTNITSMMRHKTIEFRYLDSRICDQPELFINWIKYFLLLPKIAQSRNKITFTGLNNNISAVREPGGIRFFFDRKGPTMNLPAADIKKMSNIDKHKVNK